MSDRSLVLKIVWAVGMIKINGHNFGWSTLWLAGAAGREPKRQLADDSSVGTARRLGVDQKRQLPSPSVPPSTTARHLASSPRLQRGASPVTAGTGHMGTLNDESVPLGGQPRRHPTPTQRHIPL